MPDMVCLGEALIDFVATEPCEDVGRAPGFVRAAGGAPANVAVGAARLGCSSAFLGKVGSDPFGRYLERTFSEAGVDTSGMVLDERYRTGLAFVSLAVDGERDFCFFRNPSADMTYTVSEVDFEAIGRSRIFHFGSITLIDKEPGLATLAAVKHARSTGKLVSYDPNLRAALWPSLPSARASILSALCYADIVKVSEQELSFLFSQHGDVPQEEPSAEEMAEMAAHFLRTYETLSMLVVTRGALGCSWWMAGGMHGSHPGYEVDAIDTTGAGDGFVAGMLTGILESRHIGSFITGNDRSTLSIDEAALRGIFASANAVGAITTTRKGAIPALPSRMELQHFISSRPR